MKNISIQRRLTGAIALLASLVSLVTSAAFMIAAPASQAAGTVIPPVTGVSAIWEPKIGFLVNWTPVAASVKPTSFTVTASPSGATCTAGANSNQCIFSNSTVPFPFKPFTPNTFTVVVNTAAGSSAPSAPSAPTAWVGMPGYPAPVIGKVVGTTEVDLTWVPSTSTGGVPIYGYKVYAWPYYNTSLQTVQLVTGTSVNLTGLTPNTWYEFTVAECNVYGCDASDPNDQYTGPITAQALKTKPPATLSGGNASTTCWDAVLNGGNATTATPTLTKSTTPCPLNLPPASSWPVVNPAATTFPVPAPVNRFTNLSSLMLWQISSQSLAVWAKWNGLMPIAPYFNNYGLLNSQSTVTLTSKTPTVCGISGMNVQLIAPGTCTLTAQTGGDTWYLPSAVSTGSFTITK